MATALAEADTVGATIDVHVPDTDPVDQSTVAPEAPEAAEAPQAVQPTSTPEALPWVKHRPRYVVAAFSATYLLCVAVPQLNWSGSEGLAPGRGPCATLHSNDNGFDSVVGCLELQQIISCLLNFRTGLSSFTIGSKL